MIQLTWPDLLIDDMTAEQFAEWLEPWSGIVSGIVAPAFVSKFGFWFLRRPEGHVEMLDVFSGQLHRAADTYDDFMREVNERWWQETYLGSEAIFQLHAAGMVAGPRQCYALVPHPALGGPNPFNGDPIGPGSVMVMDVVVWQTICASIVGNQ
jgi:hypothetical protein